MQRLNFLSNQNMSIISLEYVQNWRKKRGAIFIIYLTYIVILQSFILTGKEQNIFSYKCSSLLWPYTVVKFTRSGMSR